MKTFPSERGRSAAWLSAAVVGVLLMAVVGVALFRPSQRFSSPDLARPWARARFEQLTSSAPRPRPSLSSPLSEPLAVLAEPTGGTRFVLAIPRRERSQHHVGELMTKAVAGPDLRCVLPGSAEGAELELVAFSRRSADGRGPGPWLAPLSGRPVQEGLARELGEPLTVVPTQPGFTFAVALRGATLRPRGARLLERASQVELSGDRTWEQRGGYAVYSIEVHVAHRAALSLCVPVVHGPPLAATLPPAVGSTITVGATARLEVVHVGAGVVQSWGESDREIAVRATLTGRTNEPPFVVFTCWPPAAAPFLEYRSQGSKEWSQLFGPPGLAGAALDSADSALEVRALPLGALVRFDLPPLSDAPPVENLFDTRLAHFRARNAEHLCSQLCTLTLAQPQSLQLPRLPDSLFPFERIDVTVEALVRELADLSASPIGFDTERGAFTAHHATVGEIWLAALFGRR